jgi:hypothetical protein
MVIKKPGGVATESFVEVVDEVEDPSIIARLKFDGCIDFDIKGGAEWIPPHETLYLHICDVDQFIEYLQDLKIFFKEYFYSQD